MNHVEWKLQNFYFICEFFRIFVEALAHLKDCAIDVRFISFEWETFHF